ncbi:M28 family metallopeptidase [Edaphobacter albus]|uniref:M28 family metallopeptidase n=1 Tax=Edaphobacter sp. 4G125 TaxID=2763071 RepID=UPI0021083FDF|nr:M28 family metallopeptidase [Edaphobacter sp. 4G125]
MNVTSCLRPIYLAGLLLAPLAPAQQPVSPAPVDPAIETALRQVSPEHVQATIEKLVSFNNRNTLSSMEANLKSGTGINAAADWIESEFTRISADCGNCLDVRRDEFIEQPQPGPRSRILKPTKLTNVYAILHGSDPAQANRMVLVTGHYDSRNTDVMDTHNPAPGANDDASGVAVSLECARVLSKLKPPSSIVFVAVAGEEQGLNGSHHLAKLAKSQSWQLEAALNNDIVGGDTTPGDTQQNKNVVRVFSEGIPSAATPEQATALINLGAENDSPSREVARSIAEIASTYFPLTMQRAQAGNPPRIARSNLVRAVENFHPVLIFRRDRYLRGGDHSSFNAEGFPAVRFTEWRENFNHQHQNLRTENGIQYGDLLQYVDYNYVANVARLNAATLATLAFAPGIPREVHVETNNLDNNTVLTWSAPAGAPQGTAYEIVWRPTDQPLWTMVQNVGTATRIELPISKDNVIFGVRAMDAAGHRSPAVMPNPSRPTRNFTQPAQSPKS